MPSGSRGAAPAAAAIALGRDDAVPGLPTISLPGDAQPASDGRVEVAFAGSTSIDRPLRGASLAHRNLPLAELPDEGLDVLARVGRAPAWTRAGELDRVAVALPELGASDPLRSLLTGDTFLPLVPIVDFLRRVAPERFTPPDLRAAFLFDDPNLHATSYGYVDYRELAQDGRETGYHVALATIPLDAWYASRAAVRLFRSHADVLSLLVHGNDHVRRELAQPLGRDGCRRLLSQALRRIERFEGRYGVPVARVMAPPHGACSETMAAEMVEVGFDALCVSRPYPWLDSAPSERPLAGWRATEIVDSGLPVVPRVHLGLDRSEIVLRAFLRQPIVLYGHHDDVRDGLDVLREAAAQVAALGDVRWLSLDRIVKTSYDTRREGSVLHVRLQTRRADVEVPDGVDELVVTVPGTRLDDRVSVDGAPLDERSVPVEGGRTVEVRVVRTTAPPADADGAVRPAIWPYLRRGLTETRDRVRPLVARRR